MVGHLCVVRVCSPGGCALDRVRRARRARGQRGGRGADGAGGSLRGARGGLYMRALIWDCQLRIPESVRPRSFSIATPHVSPTRELDVLCSLLGALETRSSQTPLRPAHRLFLAPCLRYAARARSQGWFFLTWSVRARSRSTPSTRSPSCRSSLASRSTSASSGASSTRASS